MISLTAMWHLISPFEIEAYYFVVQNTDLFNMERPEAFAFVRLRVSSKSVGRTCDSLPLPKNSHSSSKSLYVNIP